MNNSGSATYAVVIRVNIDIKDLKIDAENAWSGNNKEKVQEFWFSLLKPGFHFKEKYHNLRVFGSRLVIQK